MVPSFLHLGKMTTTMKARVGKILVVIQLSGGNDGLNTIIPYEDDQYRRLRPTLGIDKSTLIPINEYLGLNHALGSLQGLFDNGEWSIVNEVGYPNPNRSHFRSMDIWHTGSDSDTYLHSGWLGRYLDSECNGCTDPYHAIEIGDSLSLALRGDNRDGFAMRGPEKLQKITSNPLHTHLARRYEPSGKDDNMDYLYKTMIEVQESAKYLTEKAKIGKSRKHYPNNLFAKGLRQIAELIIADTDAKIYYISLPGFDTHVNQKARQERLLKIYSDSVSVFIKDLKSHGLFNDTAIMTFSEFGRRVEENASRGTDHGAGNTLFLMNGNLKTPGFYNGMPNLSDLDDGDLRYQVDFREIYSNVLEDWLESKSRIIEGVNKKLSIL